MLFQSFALTFTAVFVALDIIGTLPMYISMTQDMSRDGRVRVANVSMAVALVVAFLFVILGERVFHFLGITLFDFRIAGGLVLLLVSLVDLVGRHEATNRASGSTGIVPLAVPLITGPGVITTLILQVSNAGYLITIVALLLNYLLAWILLRNSGRVTALIGRDGAVVISKIAALLLSAIAVGMIRGGILEAIRDAGR